MVAFWDEEVAASSLGNFIIFAAEIGRQLKRGEILKVFHHRLNPQRTKELQAALGLLNVDFLCINGRPESWDWPTSSARNNCSWTGSYGWISDQSANGLSWTWPILSDTIPESYIAVHLKQNQIDRQSNADLASWYTLFSQFDQQTFILVGDDLPPSWPALPNVSRHSGDLRSALYLVARSMGFMGMASSFCNVAILSRIPYQIFKHPNHHAEFMRMELSNKGQFSFASQNQTFHMAYDSFKNILPAYLNLVGSL